MKRVVVGLSGGVDSSVAAYLLKEQGYDVIALFMRNWVDDSVIINNECPWIDDSNDALQVAELLGIPFQVIDFSVEYKERIVDYMFKEYEAGRTPNPDVLCNREVKFDIFLKKNLSTCTNSLSNFSSNSSSFVFSCRCVELFFVFKRVTILHFLQLQFGL